MDVIDHDAAGPMVSLGFRGEFTRGGVVPEPVSLSTVARICGDHKHSPQGSGAEDQKTRGAGRPHIVAFGNNP